MALGDFLSDISDFLSGGNQSKAASFAQKGTQAFEGLATPDVNDMKIQLEGLVSQGVLTPEEAQFYEQNPTELSNITLDPQFQQAQLDALNSLQDISSSGGMTTADKANLGQIASDEASQQRGAREAILQNAQARGVGGSGLELLSQMQNQQDSATRQSQRDLDVAGMAQQRALQALQAAGSLGGEMQSNEFGRKAEIAGAQDYINQFNAQNKNQFSLANTGARNDAQEKNLAEKQRISDANTGTTNAQRQYNTQLAQQDYENQLKKASGVAGGYSDEANQAAKRGEQVTKMTGAAIQSGATAAGIPSDRNLKENIEPFDASKFLDSLTSYKYNYKNPQRDGEGEFAGPMAQDLEKTPEGDSLVEDTPEGKRVDYGKGFGTILAALTDVHNRVKNLEGR